MKKVLTVIYVIVILLMIKLVFTFFINENAISKYDRGNYKRNTFKNLYILNISEPYIAYYNDGNIYYKTGDFDKAITNYKKALELFPPKNKECSIRINLALAMIAQIDKADDSEENKEKTLNLLQNAKDILCENNCAHENDNKGHSKKAEQLKEDIESKIEELQKGQGGEEKNEEKSNSDSKQSKEDKKQQTEEQKIKAELKEIQEEGAKARKEELEKDYYLYNYEYYSGKSW